VIRPYRPADEPSWLRCRVLAYLSTDYYDDVVIEKPDLNGVELVAADGEEVVGLLDANVAGSMATLECIAVHPDRRREGIGSALLARGRDELARRGVRHMEAWTRENPVANAWYRKQGFVEVERYLHVYATGNEEASTAITAEEGLLPIQAFLHVVDMEREAEMRERFGRVYLCRCYQAEVGAAP